MSNGDWSFHVNNQLTRNDHPQYQLTSGMGAFQPIASNPTTLVQSLTASTNLAVTGGDGLGHGTLTVATIAAPTFSGAVTVGSLVNSSDDVAWTNVASFTNSWVNFGGAFFPAGFRSFGGRIYLRGNIKNGSAINTAAFTLPVGYRPSATALFVVTSNGIFGQCNITSAGVVTPAVGSTTAFSLDGVSFDTL